MGAVAKAIEHFQRALTIHQTRGDLYGQAIQLTNLGLCFRQLADVEQARSYFVRARELFERMGFPEDHPRRESVRRAIDSLGARANDPVR